MLESTQQQNFSQQPEQRAPGQTEPVYEIDKELSSEPEELISVMPTRFKKGHRVEAARQVEVPTKKPKGKFFVILIIVIIVLVVAGGGAGFYFWAKDYLRAPKAPKESAVKPPVTQEVTESKELRLSAEIVDPAGQEIISTAELFFPVGALEPDKIFELIGTFQPTETTTSTYQYLGGIYKIGPEIPILKKKADLKITYATRLIDLSWETEIKIGYLKDNFWTILPSQIDINTNTVSAALEVMPADTFALLIDQTKIKPQTEEIQIAPQLFSSSDQDNDGLTDQEEQIYQTNLNNPDTDGDGQSDGLEIATLSDPTHADGTLALSGLVKVFNNEKWLYSVFYPNGWLTKPLPETDMTQIMVITNTGEFFEISVENNSERLTPKEWYLKQSTQANLDQTKETTILDQSAIWSPDRLNLYISKDDKIYILTYNLGTEEEANFKTTFRMLIKSFQFIEKSVEQPEIVPEGKVRGARSDGALIKYPDSPAVYLLENGKKRPIKSETALQRLGYSWDNIVEVPIEEWYPDGQLIE